MEIYVSFDEMHAYAEKHFGKDVNLKKIADNQFSVGFTANLLLVKVTPSVDITIEDVKSDEVTLKYHVAFGIDKIIGGSIPMLLNKFKEKTRGIYVEDDNRIRVKLSEMEKAKPAMEKIALNTISVKDKYLKVTLFLK